MDKIIMGIAVGFGDPDGTWKRYVEACKHLKIDYEVIDIISGNWLSRITAKSGIISGLLVGPPCMNIEEYDIYMERLYFIGKELSIPTYPSYNELKLYENKRYCTAWLEYHGFPMPKTAVICHKVEAKTFIQNTKYPFVVKASIGAGSSAVHIVKTRSTAKRIISHVFGWHRLLVIGYISWVQYKNFPIKIPLIGSSLRHYMIVQEFIPIKWEWRIIKIGNSYFGHQKLLKGDYASGSDKVGWVAPPVVLLDMVRKLCLKGNFNSMAVDIFESDDGSYYINECQSMFGSYDISQMYIDGKPGRYTYTDGKYEFEEGYFNLYGSCLLRVEHFKEILENQLSVASSNHA